MEYAINQIRNDFPILSAKVHGKPLVYFDNGATTQKPLQVISRLVKYYETENSNVHRGAHHLSNLATQAFEDARKYIARFINAANPAEVIFTRGTTESVNLVCTGINSLISSGDEVVITAMEHHSNLVPWQQLCEKKGANLKVIPVIKSGELDMNAAKKMLTSRVKIFAVTHISNVLGTINPIKELVTLAHSNAIPVLVDGAQAIAHVPVNVQELDCEFYAFSAHKAYGPMGIGILYGKSAWLEKLSPYQYGGEMIDQVTFEKTTFNGLPYKFEAGTPNVADVLGMETALRYIENIGINNIREHEDVLLDMATQGLSEIPGLQIVGQSKNKTAVLSFVVEGVHPYDLGVLLDQMGFAVRTGNHCAQPLVESLGLTGTVRASFGLYNTTDEVKGFLHALKKAVLMLQ